MTSYPTRRETIHVWGTDAQRVAGALPVLLPQLGIPVDAVGVVAQSDDTVYYDEPTLLDEPPQGTGVNAFGVSIWTAGGGTAAGLAILASATLLVMRLRRRRA